MFYIFLNDAIQWTKIHHMIKFLYKWMGNFLSPLFRNLFRSSLSEMYQMSILKQLSYCSVAKNPVF